MLRGIFLLKMGVLFIIDASEMEYKSKDELDELIGDNTLIQNTNTAIQIDENIDQDM